MNKGLIKLKNMAQLFLIAMVLLLLAFIVVDGRGRLARSNIMLAEEQAALENEIAELDRALQEKQYISSDAFLEQIIRNELGRVRPDDIVFVIDYE